MRPDDAQREERIRANFWLVKKIARRLSRLLPGCDVDDLVGDGALGLIRAADTFDPMRARSFEGYAGKLIAGAMFNGLRRMDTVSERVRREMRRAEAERYELAAQRGSLPGQPEMETRRPALRRAVTHVYRHTPLSIDIPLPSDERLSPDWSSDAALLAQARMDREQMRSALERLSARQRHIVGLFYFKRQSLRQIGRDLGISSQRASQLHRAALRNLRRAMHVTPAR